MITLSREIRHAIERSTSFLLLLPSCFFPLLLLRSPVILILLLSLFTSSSTFAHSSLHFRAASIDSLSCFFSSFSSSPSQSLQDTPFFHSCRVRRASSWARKDRRGGSRTLRTDLGTWSHTARPSREPSLLLFLLLGLSSASSVGASFTLLAPLFSSSPLTPRPLRPLQQRQATPRKNLRSSSLALRPPSSSSGWRGGKGASSPPPLFSSFSFFFFPLSLRETSSLVSRSSLHALINFFPSSGALHAAVKDSPSPSSRVRGVYTPEPCCPLASTPQTSFPLLPHLKQDFLDLRSLSYEKETPSTSSAFSSFPFFRTSSSSSSFLLLQGSSLPEQSQTRLRAATRSGVAVPPHVASFGKTFVYAFLKPLKKEQIQTKGGPGGRDDGEEEGREMQEEEEAPGRGGKKKKKARRRSYFQDFDESYDRTEEVRRLNELHKFFAVHAYPTTTTGAPAALAEAASDQDEEPSLAHQKEEQEGEEEEESSDGASSPFTSPTRRGLDPPPPCLPLPRGGRLSLPLGRRKRSARLLFPSPLPRSSSSSSSSSSGAFCPCPSSLAFSPSSSSSPLPPPSFPSLAIPANLSAWGGFPLPATARPADRQSPLLAPSLLGDWLLTQAMARQRMQSLNIFAFDSEALPIKASEGAGVRTEDERGITIEGTLAAHAESAPAKTGLRNEEEERRALDQRNQEIALNLRQNQLQDGQKIRLSDTGPKEQEEEVDGSRGQERGRKDRGRKSFSETQVDSPAREDDSLSPSPSSSSSSVGGVGRRVGEGFEAYLEQLEESGRGGGVAMEMWVPGVRARDILVELRLVGREEALDKEQQEEERRKTEEDNWELDEDYIFKEKVAHVEDRMFTKEKKKWIPTILPMLIVNLPKSRRVLRWEIETFRTRQRKGRLASYDRIQRAYRLVWPADIRRAEARLDSGRLLVVVPPLPNLSEFDPFEDARNLLPLRVQVEEKPLPWTGLKGFRVYHSRRDWIFNYHKFPKSYPPGQDLYALDFKAKDSPVTVRPADKKEELEAQRMAKVISSKNWRKWRGPKL